MSTTDTTLLVREQPDAQYTDLYEKFGQECAKKLGYKVL